MVESTTSLTLTVAMEKRLEMREEKITIWLVRFREGSAELQRSFKSVKSSE